MPKDPIGESWTGGAYNGFAGHSGRAAPPPPSPAAPPPGGPTRRRNLMLGGLAGAVGLGLVFGLWARPQLGEDREARRPMAAVTARAEDVPAPAVPVEVARPEPAPPPRSDGPLEVLPPELARAAPAAP
ncbi:hypothetical protein, partial [Phenylobacterium sp.]|uniref:hypothetical protein n=1 Tax=Phenylobacterium sp. TaxID=1871053 RepID=UPI0035AFA168